MHTSVKQESRIMKILLSTAKSANQQRTVRHIMIINNNNIIIIIM